MKAKKTGSVFAEALRIAAAKAKAEGREVPFSTEGRHQDDCLQYVHWNVLLARADDVEYTYRYLYRGDALKDALAEIYSLPKEEAWQRFLKDAAHLLPEDLLYETTVTRYKDIRVDIKDIYQSGVPAEEQAWRAFISYVEFCLTQDRWLIHPILLGVKPVIVYSSTTDETYQISSAELDDEFRRIVKNHRQGKVMRINTRQKPAPNESVKAFVQRVIARWAEAEAK